MARLLNGTNQYIKATSNPIASSTGKITLSVWLNHTSVPLAEGYATCCGTDSGALINYTLSADPGTGGYRFVYTTATSTYVSFATVDSFDFGVWHNVIFAGDYSLAGSKFYKDGVSQSFSTTSGTPGSPTSSASQVIVGGFVQPVTPIALFSGMLADIAVWDVILTAGEVLALARGIRPKDIRPARLSWFPLDGIESPEPDLSGNANNGVVTGATLAAGPPIAMFTPRWPINSEVAAAPSFIPAWANGSNLPVLGTGIF